MNDKKVSPESDGSDAPGLFHAITDNAWSWAVEFMESARLAYVQRHAERGAE